MRNLTCQSTSLASPRLASPRLASPRLASPRLACPLFILVTTYFFTVFVTTCCGQDDEADFEKKKQEFVISQVRKTVESQFMAPVLIRANDLSRFLDLPADDHYRLIVASKGAASAVADDFRFPEVAITHRPWKEFDQFTLNGKTIEFPEDLGSDKKGAPVAMFVSPCKKNRKWRFTNGSSKERPTSPQTRTTKLAKTQISSSGKSTMNH